MRFRLPAFAFAALLATGNASAIFHDIMVKEVFTGSVAAPNAHYIVLQAWAMSQNSVDGHSVTIFDAEGQILATFMFDDNVAHGENQMTILVATPEAETLFSITADFPMTSALSRYGGKACWGGATPPDCVAWGNYTGSATGVGNPIAAPAGIPPGQALRRRLDVAGSPTLLEAADDTDDSENDFTVVTALAPRNNAGETGTSPAATCGNNVVEGLEQCDDGGSGAEDGCSPICRWETFVDTPGPLSVDEAAPGLLADNGILEPGETVDVRPTWTNNGQSAVTLDGLAAFFTGPAGATYGIVDGSAAYGTLDPGESVDCLGQPEGCYSLSVSAPATRPAAHWDATLTEVLSNTKSFDWPIHVGESFADVPTGHPFYAFIETLFHAGITGGCAGGYCPANPVTRAQMAVFLLKAKFGQDHTPPACTGAVFTDVPCTGGPFDPWIEELAGLQITGGCGGTLYCPNNTVTRAQMAVFLLKTLETSSYDPPDCIGVFDDVPCTPGTGFSDWIEELYNRLITGGCSVSPPLYCPNNPNNRGQMAVFLVKTFNLLLYGFPLPPS